jgi:phage terminase large subunit GpA-like protein
LQQLCAEQLITRRDRNGFAHREWQKMRERNEALDCYVYARAAAAASGLDRFEERHFQELERQLLSQQESFNAAAMALQPSLQSSLQPSLQSSLQSSLQPSLEPSLQPTFQQPDALDRTVFTLATPSTAKPSKSLLRPVIRSRWLQR